MGTGPRLIDAGTVSPLRSQALWHGLASAIRPGDRPVLSLCRPASAYVGIGYHRRLDELDLSACPAPVLRRRIGGGPVWLDSDQLFFQLVQPADGAPWDIGALYRSALGPAVEALRGLGVDARLDGPNDIVVGGARREGTHVTPTARAAGPARKLSGTGAGRIGDGVVVVGNVLFRFPHERMASVLALPDEAMRADLLALLRDHVSSLHDEGFGHLSQGQVRDAIVDAYGAGEPDALTDSEQQAIARWERRLADPAWLDGPDLPARTGRLVKLRRDVHLAHVVDDGLAVVAAVEGGALRSARVEAAHLNGTRQAIEQALAGAPVDGLAARLAGFGEDGRRIARALEPVLARRD